MQTGSEKTVLTPQASRCVMTQIVMPSHTNGAAGVMFGGVMMQWIDVCAGVSAMRHSGGAVVTASIDRLDFIVPVHVGDVVILESQVNFVRKTSMEVGCRVQTENPTTRKRRYTTKAYLTFVGTDSEGRPRPVPELIVEGAEDLQRHADAEERRRQRLLAVGRTDS